MEWGSSVYPLKTKMKEWNAKIKKVEPLTKVQLKNDKKSKVQQTKTISQTKVGQEKMTKVKQENKWPSHMREIKVVRRQKIN